VPNHDTFIRGLPKAELHMHLEGSIEPQLMLDLAQRNSLKPRWNTAAELRAAYQFTNLQSFLDLYFEGCRVLIHEQDFYDVTAAYLARAHQDGVTRTEIFFGPQSFTERGIAIATMMNGILRAIDDGARKHAISAALLVSAHRHRTQADALALLDQIAPWHARVPAIGLGGPEIGNPPSKFTTFFRTCQDNGFRTTIHAGEEGPATYVRQALDLGVDRIDHGIACLTDPGLVRDLAERKIPLTVCPLSNLRLKVVPSLAQHPLKTLMDAGVHVTVNSDDPPYFDGYVSENLIECQHALHLSKDDIVTLARNSFNAAFITQDEAAGALAQIDAYTANFR
jgi:adenosine deaminase